MTNSAANPSTAGDQVVNGLKFVGDIAVIPGIGQMVEGNVGKGIVYGVTGIAANAVLGPWAWIATGLDSYSVSSSGKHLWELFGTSSAAASPSPTNS